MGKSFGVYLYFLNCQNLKGNCYSSETFEKDMLSVFGESTNVDLGRTIIDILILW